LKDRLIAFLPRYAPVAARLAPLANLRDRVPLLARLSEMLVGLSAKRSLPKWQARPFLQSAAGRYQVRAPEDCDVVLLADTFNNYFEPENAVAALRVLEAAGYRVHVARPVEAGRPLCCGHPGSRHGEQAGTRRSGCSRRSCPMPRAPCRSSASSRHVC
jgi:Fe-S oxidoreductase